MYDFKLNILGFWILFKIKKNLVSEKKEITNKLLFIKMISFLYNRTSFYFAVI